MAFVVPTRRGGFEIRESRATPRGPRSRTLATFHELTDEVIEKAREKAERPPDAEDLRRAARRAGAQVSPPPADRAARTMITELGRGREPEPRLTRILGKMLEHGSTVATSPPDPATAVAEWMTATPRERGNALVDLLLLADALPSGGREGKQLEFPRLQSKMAG